MKKDDLNICSYGQGENVILIHGLGWDGSIWQKNLPQLSSHHRIHVVTLPARLTNIEKLCTALIEQCPDPAVWLGWSAGGLIALHAAYQHSKQVKKLILVASSPHFIKKMHWPGLTLDALEQLDLHFQINKAQAIKKFIRLQTNGNYLLTKELLTLTHPSYFDTSGFTLLKNTDYITRLKKISCPMLGIFGKHDRLIPLEVSTFLQQYMMIQLFDTAHLPFYEAPILFNQAITQFIQNAA